MGGQNRGKVHGTRRGARPARAAPMAPPLARFRPADTFATCSPHPSSACSPPSPVSVPWPGRGTSSATRRSMRRRRRTSSSSTGNRTLPSPGASTSRCCAASAVSRRRWRSRRRPPTSSASPRCRSPSRAPRSSNWGGTARASWRSNRRPRGIPTSRWCGTRRATPPTAWANTTGRCWRWTAPSRSSRTAAPCTSAARSCVVRAGTSRPRWRSPARWNRPSFRSSAPRRNARWPSPGDTRRSPARRPADLTPTQRWFGDHGASLLDPLGRGAPSLAGAPGAGVHHGGAGGGVELHPPGHDRRMGRMGGAGRRALAAGSRRKVAADRGGAARGGAPAGRGRVGLGNGHAADHCGARRD